MPSILDTTRRRKAPTGWVRVLAIVVMGTAILLVGALRLSAVNDSSAAGRQDSAVSVMQPPHPGSTLTGTSLDQVIQTVMAVRRMRDEMNVPQRDSADLQSPDVEIRKRAIGRLPGKNASGARLMAQSLMAPDRRVRTLAAIELDSVVSAAAVPAWISVLNDTDASIRERAAISLGVIGDPGAIDALTSTLLNDTEPAVRRQAARGLGYIASGGGD